MTDSVKVLQTENVDRLHSKRGPSGKLYKGQAVTAASASIPSSYQTIVVDNSEKKGFNSYSKRFNYDLYSDDKPGPGSYIGISNSGSNSSASFSKRGSGMMASKDKRLMRPVFSSGPSPNAYNVALGLQSRNDFNRSTVSSTFHLPIAVQRPKSTGPAPNQYNAAPPGRTNSLQANAAFKSKTKRELLLAADAKHKVSPCQYDVRVDAVHDSVHVPMSSFKSKTSRQFPPQPLAVPGPGQYKPFEPVESAKKTQFPRHNYLCLSAPAMPLPAEPLPPGPASYDVHIYGSFGDATKATDSTAGSAAFISTSKRWSTEINNTGNFPSPAHYNPVKIGKQSFMFNSSSRWI